MKAEKPANEAERLAALDSYQVWDSESEANFDRLTRTARLVFHVPVCVLSFLGSECQFFKSKIGVTCNGTPRDWAFCAHTILQDETTVVCDATTDPRFADNPLVTDHLKIRFYVGAPLKTRSGLKVGSLSVIDTESRPFPPMEQITVLEDLAAQAVELLEASRTKREAFGLQRDLEGMREKLSAGDSERSRTEQTAALAMEAGKMGFWEWDAAESVVRWSARLFDMMGFSAVDAPPSTREWLRRLHREDRGPFLKKLRDVRQSQETFTVKYRFLRTGAGERWMTSVGKHYFADGRLLRAVGVCWDSTEQDLSERALAQSEELFRTLSSSSPIGIFRTDREGNTIYVNPRLCEIWGLPATELLGERWKSRLHPYDARALPDARLDFNSGGPQLQREYRLVMPDGEVRWVQSTAAVVHDRDGKPMGKVGTVDDITERKNTLLAWQLAKESAEIASRSKDLFLANVSHELRTPLNGVLGMTDLLLESDLTPEQREMAEIVRDSGRSLLMVVNDILDVSRIEAGKLVIERSPFEWKTMIHQVRTLMEPEAQKKGIGLDFRQTPNIVPWLVGDAGRIKQVLLVFLTNALKFTMHGGVMVEVATDAIGPDECELLIAVHDTGPGLSAEQQEKLFQPFSQVDPSSTRKHGGVGLGLSIARKLAELMGGRVGVMSSPGEGSTFWLRLVLPVVSEPPKPSVAPANLSGASGCGRILLAEDNPVNQTVALAGLKRLGWQADIAATGFEALALIKDHRYSMVLMDCQMPDMDGYTATRKIREWEKEERRTAVPIVALTAHAMQGDRERCLEAGMNDYLAKPFGLKDLQGALERWASSTAASDELVEKEMVA